MSKLTRYIALMVLAFWGLASVHCKLEAAPGMGFLKTCCFADLGANSHSDCETDGCSLVEDGKYLSPTQSISVPQGALVVALLPTFLEVPLPQSRACPFSSFKGSPEAPRPWQFSCRTALSPRAPSILS